ncbi:2OG-Fe dioxygenase family protein [Streptomyces sp. NBC_01324]|uniref:2OG-Fe dioxygenase family protein n=1 Tax=Streptomyces sp. NBC_01324 TaxID=2903826 RepID=UPI002E0F0918|nr:2OG-Fe dioxygenase family protein [Streptomyces sp. NBC_01324]
MTSYFLVPAPVSDVVGGIAARGFALVEGETFFAGASGTTALDMFGAAWNSLPPDDYLPEKASYRQRRYTRFILEVGSDRPWPVWNTGYLQPGAANPLVGDRVRRFPPLLASQANDPFLRALILRDAEVFDICAGGRPTHWEVDVHMIRVTADRNALGQPSPEGRHRDGFDYIALHHMGRENVTGGVTEIYDPAGHGLTRHMFTRRLDSMYADDTRILHDVTPLAPGPNGPTGHRDMLLTSFTAR